jgi:hypothetical protein
MDREVGADMKSPLILICMVLSLGLAACTTGGVVPTAPGGPSSEPVLDPTGDPGAGFASLTGTVTYQSDGSNANGASTIETHVTLVLNVNLVSDDGYTFHDAGSTYTLSATSAMYDPQTTSSCGLQTDGTGQGSGPFSAGGLINAFVDTTSEEEVTLSVHAPYESTQTLTFLCNGVTSTDSSDSEESPSCGDPSGSWLIGELTGSVADMTCSESMAIGEGGVQVTGTLTASR